MTYFTLSVGGIEKKLSDWGILDDISFEWTSKADGTCTFRTTERFDPGATQFQGPQSATTGGGMPFTSYTQAIFYRDRTSSTGAPGSFSAGLIYFQGYFDDPKRTTSGNRENVEYTVHNTWWLFMRHPFAQHRNQFAGFDNTHTHVAALSIANGGTGYAVGNVVTIPGGTGTAATFEVASINPFVGGGVVTSLSPTNGGGRYTANPSSPASPTGGSGSGLSVNMTMGPAPLLVDKVLSEIYLMEGVNAAGYDYQQTTGAQIIEVINWMNTCYNPVFGANVVQVGTIDPNTFAPITRSNTVFCSEAIQTVLRWEPDAVVFFDDTTTPPTLHVRKMGKWNNATIPPTFIDYTNLPEVAFTISTDQEKDIQAASQGKRQLPGVLIYYSAWNTDGNVVFKSSSVDKFPAGVTDFTPEASRHTIELAGTNVQYVTATIKGIAISDAVSGTAANRKSWWQAHDNTLNNPKVNASTITAAVATVKDKNGVAINTTLYQYELDGCTVPYWLPGLTVKAQVVADLGYDTYHDVAQTNKARSDVTRPHSKGVKLTTVAPGNYSRPSSITPGEIPPQGVAESVYRSLNAVQFAGSITFVDLLLRVFSGIGVRLKLIGPNTTFTNCLVQNVKTEPHYGRTTISFGPSTPVDLDSWIELARASRRRTTWNMPSNRGTGGSDGDETDFGAESPVDDTVHGAGGQKLDSGTFRQV